MGKRIFAIAMMISVFSAFLAGCSGSSDSSASTDTTKPAAGAETPKAEEGK